MPTDPPATDHGATDHRADDHRAWRVMAPSGLLLVGAALSITTDAATRRARDGWTPAALAGGTAGLLLMGAGLSVFGEAVKRRALFDVAERAAHS